MYKDAVGTACTCVCMLKGEFNGGCSYGAQSVIKYS